MNAVQGAGVYKALNRDPGFRVQGFKVWGLGLRVSGLGYGICRVYMGIGFQASGSSTRRDATNGLFQTSISPM